MCQMFVTNLEGEKSNSQSAFPKSLRERQLWQLRARVSAHIASGLSQSRRPRPRGRGTLDELVLPDHGRFRAQNRQKCHCPATCAMPLWSCLAMDETLSLWCCSRLLAYSECPGW